MFETREPKGGEFFRCPCPKEGRSRLEKTSPVVEHDGSEMESPKSELHFPRIRKSLLRKDEETLKDSSINICTWMWDNENGRESVGIS